MQEEKKDAIGFCLFFRLYFIIFKFYIHLSVSFFLLLALEILSFQNILSASTVCHWEMGRELNKIEAEMS